MAINYREEEVFPLTPSVIDVIVDLYDLQERIFFLDALST